ncbi:MAG: PfkB family carbohydrate kinase [Myxococcales bacterium]|nr:PfkB family carbohydrate kinase [Myxococcota bacterium]MDW8280840.1 PfkB family carbohydrate kinase [Myxococcales bacterium]
MSHPHDLLVVGSVALDSVETVSAFREEVLGGSASFVSVAASFFCPVRLVAVVGDDFPPEHVAYLEERGIDIEGLQRQAGRTFRWRGRYSSDLNHRTTLDTQLNVFAGFRPELPPACRRTGLVFLANIDPTLQLEVLSQVERPLIVGMDTMNFWIEGSRAALERVLQRIDFLLLNEEEARLLSQDHNLSRAARAIQRLGPTNVVVKRGDAGALLFHGEQVFAAPAMPLSEVVDPTGAGDAFAGGFMGYLARTWTEGPLDGRLLRRAMICGSTMASFCCEDFSLDRFRTLQMDQIEERFSAFRHLTHFEDLTIT